MMSYILNRPLEDLDDLGSHFFEPEFSGNNSHNPTACDISIVVKTHVTPLRLSRFKEYSPVIYLVRDPRDVATSYLIYKLSYIPNLLKTRGGKYLFKRTVCQIIFYYVLMSKRCDPLSLRRRLIADISNDWSKHVDQALSSHGVYLISYESLMTQTAEVLRSVLQHLSVNVDDSVIDEAVRKYKFKKQAFASASHLGNTTMFSRKGKVGSYKDFLSDQEVSALFQNSISKYNNLFVKK